MAARDLRVHFFLADAASTDRHTKLNMLGAGWTVTPAPMGPHAVVALIQTAPEAEGERLDLAVQLLDATGEPVIVDAPGGPIQIGTQGSVVMGSPQQDVPAELPLTAAFNMSVGPLPLQPGRYEWRLRIGEDTWTAPFAVVNADVPVPDNASA